MKKKEEKEPNHERWLLTYSDLITLLMIFFVIMYASSNLSATKYKQVSESFSLAFNGGGKSVIGDEAAVSVAEQSNKVLDKMSEEDKMESIKKDVDGYLKKSGISDNVTTQINERGLQVSLKDAMFFDSGKAEIKEESRKKIINIGKILNDIGNYVRIEGHTDSTPIHNSRFASNWQLSAIRATNVTELLISQSGIPPQRISAVGYGEHRPVASNKTEAGRAKNRTVDIIILSSKFSKTEKTK